MSQSEQLIITNDLASELRDARYSLVDIMSLPFRLELTKNFISSIRAH
jgi:hypothetical protein